MKFIGGLVALIIIVPILAAVFFIATFDEKAFRANAMKQVSTALGRDVVVEGPIGLDVHNGIALSLKEVSIGNPQGFSEKNFAKVGTLFVSVDWQALLVRKVNVNKITLENTQIDLVTTAAGQNNWDFPMGKNAAPVAPNAKRQENMLDELAAAAKEGRQPDFSINSVALSNVEITNASVNQIDHKASKKQSFVVKHAVLKVPASGSFHADGEGLVNGAPIKVKLDTQKSLREVKEGETIPLDLQLSYNNQDYNLKGNFSFKGKTYRFEHLDAKLMGISLTGSLQADMGGAIPDLSGNISTPELNLTKLTPATKADNGRLLARPVAASTGSPLAVLRSFNSDVVFTTPRLVASPTMSLENVNTRIKVANGVLTLDPLKMTYQGVPWTGMVSADAASNLRVALQAQNVDYQQLAASFGTKSPVASRGDISFDLSGHGLSAEEFQASANGKIEVTSGAGAVDFNGGNGMGGAMIKALVPVSATEKPKLSCAAVRFNVISGMLKSNGLLLDSNYATVGGDGTVNLANQNVDMVLRPVPKGATTVTSLTSATPIRVRGTLSNLSYVPEADAILQKAVGGIFSPGQKISTGVPMVSANAAGNPCVAALNNPQMIMVDPPKTEQIIKDVRDTVKDQYKGIRDAIKNPKEGLGNLLGIKQPAPAAQPTAQPAAALSPQPEAAPAVAPAAAPEAAPAAQPSKADKAMDALKGMFGK
jgi:uncharacterized protein involved in outer membrane biogenesis